MELNYKYIYLTIIMKKIVFTKNTEEKINNIFPNEYYDVKNHTTFVNQLYLNQSYDYC